VADSSLQLDRLALLKQPFQRYLRIQPETQRMETQDLQAADPPSALWV